MNGASRTGPLRVYVVEDSVSLRRALIHEFKQIDGLEIVGETDSVAEANVAVREVRPDVLILDFHLRDGNALQVLQTLQNGAHRPLSIVITNDPLNTYREACLAAGAARFLDKSLDFAGLLALLARLAGGVGGNSQSLHNRGLIVCGAQPSTPALVSRSAVPSPSTLTCSEVTEWSTQDPQIIVRLPPRTECATPRGRARDC
jgi:DNA-binding NarL/FixJ family response regulator